ncbi:MmcQ/YjbR family DNA-binding protein [Pseudonocardia sp. TRM90224]|uniref:MmcQ/YjbR family DNA-binding protein n=1 Tax=Pseudonocardia sp. TRM90224 TaxID=2812678 RepID=UPI001E5B664E|nr:MmcQ/YjbR family DNA-binding protein [Pseudonocardia sp. TRM90224]
MTDEELAAVLIGLPHTTVGEPFGPDVFVYKVAGHQVAGKVFALHRRKAAPAQLTLKCDPARALLLRDHYPAVTPGYHTNKRHWNTVVLDGSVPDDDLLDFVHHSYELVVAGLPARLRATGEYDLEVT